jgi:hypothetical protein
MVFMFRFLSAHRQPANKRAVALWRMNLGADPVDDLPMQPPVARLLEPGGSDQPLILGLLQQVLVMLPLN